MQSLRAIFETLRVDYANIYQSGQELFKAASPMDRTQVLEELVTLTDQWEALRFAFEEIGDFWVTFFIQSKIGKNEFLL